MNLRLATTLLTTTALLLAACTGSDDATPDPADTPLPTLTATATPTASSTPPPEDPSNLPPGLTASPPGTWRQLELAPGDPVPDILGAFIADAATGTGTLWSLNPAAIENPDYALVSTTPDGNYVTVSTNLVNTASGQSFAWTGQARFRQIDDRGYAIFTSPRGCSFWLVDLSGAEPQPVAAHELPTNITQGDCALAARLSPDATELLAIDYTTLFSINLATGVTTELATIDASSVRFSDGPHGDEAAFLTASLPGVAWVTSYRWSDGALTTTSIETGAVARNQGKAPRPPGRLLISPDGRWAAWTDSDDLGTGYGAGGIAEWPVVVIASIEDATPVVRAQRVALTNGIVTFQWLPDSSALVVQSEDGFALLTPDGALQPLPFPVAFHSDPVPIPAPDASSRFLYNGRVVDATSNEVTPTPAVTEAWGGGPNPSWWTRNFYDWATTADRIILTRTEFPAGDFGRGGIATLGLPPRITTGPAAATPDEPIRLRVASDGDNLNVRAAPGLAAERIGRFPHGTLITLSRDTTIDYCGDRGCSILNDPDLPYGDSWWLYVRDENGLEGWVTSEFVEWTD
jgi:SH3 domain-containing protein